MSINVGCERIYLLSDPFPYYTFGHSFLLLVDTSKQLQTNLNLLNTGHSQVYVHNMVLCMLLDKVIKVLIIIQKVQYCTVEITL